MPVSVRALLLALCWLAPAPALAVVIATGSGSGNTSAPPDDPGFANVGESTNGLTGVYLGNRWVLTAAHVGEPDFVFDGVLYHTVPGSRRKLSKAGVRADLAMMKLAGPAPPLPDVKLPTAPIAVGDVVTMIGHGWSRGPDLRCWNGGWTEVACPSGVFEGYFRSGPRTMRWGRNRVTAVDQDEPAGSTWTRAFELRFDAAGELHEAQVVPGDSGGASFLKRGDEWELVGIHFLMGIFMSQPSDATVFGNLSYEVDVFHYRDEIEAIFLLAPQVPSVPWPALLACAGALLGATRLWMPRAR